MWDYVYLIPLMLSGHLSPSRGCFIPWKKAWSSKVLFKTTCSWFAFMGSAYDSLPLSKVVQLPMGHSLTQLVFSRSESGARSYIPQATDAYFLRSHPLKLEMGIQEHLVYWVSLSGEREWEKQDSVRNDVVLAEDSFQLIPWRSLEKEQNWSQCEQGTHILY